LPSLHQIGLAIVGKLEGIPHDALAHVNNGVGVLFDDREMGLNMSESSIGQLISLCDIGLCIAVWGLEVRLYRLAKALVCAVSQIN
jgi:hypothetical protein